MSLSKPRCISHKLHQACYSNMYEAFLAPGEVKMSALQYPRFRQGTQCWFVGLHDICRARTNHLACEATHERSTNKAYSLVWYVRGDLSSGVASSSWK